MLSPSLAPMAGSAAPCARRNPQQHLMQPRERRIPPRPGAGEHRSHSADSGSSTAAADVCSTPESAGVMTALLPRCPPPAPLSWPLARRLDARQRLNHALGDHRRAAAEPLILMRLTTRSSGKSDRELASRTGWCHRYARPTNTNLPLVRPTGRTAELGCSLLPPLHAGRRNRP